MSFLLEYFPVAMSMNNKYFLFITCVCVLYAIINKDVIVFNRVNFLPALFLLTWTSYSFLVPQLVFYKTGFGCAFYIDFQKNDAVYHCKHLL